MALRSRQVHLDFHTSPHIRDVGAAFDPETFAQTFVAANVNSVTVFAKCHHGHLYYDTDRAERHPGLPRELDLLRVQIDALHARDIRAPIYISVLCDEFAANTHPEWVARDADDRPISRGAEPGWQILDMSSPYQEYLAAQLAEVLVTFHPVDGIFFDMCWDQPSMNATHPPREVSLQYMRRFRDMVNRSNPAATVYFNSRFLSDLPGEIDCYSHLEIEALPSGGWGYMYFPKFVRYARNFGLPYLGMTARFHKGWADFGGMKSRAALMYETCQMLAHGAACSIGDQLHPRGAPNAAAYQLIGDVYAYVHDCEPWCIDAKPVTEIGVLLAGAGRGKNSDGTDEGVVRMLTQLRHQFDLLPRDADFSRYRLIVLPDEIAVDESLAAKVRAFVESGGALLATGMSGMSADGTSSVLARELGIVALGLSPFTTTYFRAGKRIAHEIAPTDHVLYERTVRVAPAPGALSVAVIVEPYFERSREHFSSHRQTPPDKLTKYSVAVLNGRAAYIAAPIFGMFARHGNTAYRTLVGNLLDILLPDRLLRASGPTGLETTVMQQTDRTIVHLLHFSPERRARDLDLIEDIIPLRDIALSLRSDQQPTRVTLAPSDTPIPFTWADGRIACTVPQIDGHGTVVFDYRT